MLLLSVHERCDDLGVCIVQSTENLGQTGSNKTRIGASPLEDRVFVPLLKRLITHNGPRHLLVLLVDGLLRKGQQFGSIVAFKSYTLAVQVSYLTESLTRNGSRSCERCRCLHR
jgi:hypothetical protein